MKNYKKLAELIGIILGDGNLHKSSNCITIVGSLEDLFYYENYVIPIIKSLFPVNPKLMKRNDRNAYYIDINSKIMMSYLVDELGLIRGNKINAKIPRIIKCGLDLSSHFLRGLFDTDGCLKFSKQTKNINYYPRIQIALKDYKLVIEVKELLIKMGFSFAEWKDKRNGVIFYQISGKYNLEKWMNLVGSSNPVHKTKYLYWVKYGHYIPKSSLKFRLKSLDLNIGYFF